MRLRLELLASRPVRVPTDHYEQLRGAIYYLLGQENADLARFLHDDGYGLPREKGFRPDASGAGANAADTRRYKLFTFSQLRVDAYRRRLDGAQLTISPGPIEWLISSPRRDFLEGEVNGLLRSGAEIRVGDNLLSVAGMTALPEPVFSSETIAGTCLTPIVLAVPSQDGRLTPRYLRPVEPEAFSAAIRANLLQKLRVLAAIEPAFAETDIAAAESDPFAFAFDAAYLSRRAAAGKRCTKKITLDNLDLIGAAAPFNLTAHPSLLQTAYTCGLGQRNASGLGMIAAQPITPGKAVENAI